MSKYLFVSTITVLLLLQSCIVLAATEITGTITAKRGDTVKVEFQPNKTAGPMVGDEVKFSYTDSGIFIGAGTGKVTEVTADSVWVKAVKKNLKLKMKAVIHATGLAKSKKMVRKNSKPPLHRCDELARDPYDSQRIGPAVKHRKIDPSSAIFACTEALQTYPDNVRFLFQLGRAFAADKQYQAAYSHFKKAADKGHITAQNYIGDLFSQGWGVAKDKTEAYRWYLKAAEQGHVLAQYHVGGAYWDGIVVSQDLTEAVKWFRKSAEQGGVDAQINMGIVYEEGNVVTKNLATAEKWYRKAASQEVSNRSVYALGRFLFYNKDEEQSKREAAKWFQKAAKKGHKLAQFQLGYMYYTGTGVQRDDTLAVKWYRKSADNGVAVAQYNLGLMYYNGEGVDRNLEKAKKWFQKAADQKQKNAIKMLKRLKDEN